MLVLPKSLSLIVTHRCTAACDHCCFDCSPEKSDTIPEENLLRYIDQAKDVKSIRVVVFTGGECFLLGEALDRCVRRAFENGFMTRFVSNGYWATSKSRALTRIQKLVAAGLTEANFSTGDMHARYVKPEFVRNGAIAAARSGLTSLIMIEMFQNSSFDLDAFVSTDPEFSGLVESGKILLNPSVWMPFSGKTEISYSERFRGLKSMGTNRGCTTMFNVISINPKEELISCCGLTQEQIPELHMGSLRDRTIKQILDQSSDDFIKIWIHLEGPQAVIEYARKYDTSISDGDDYAHICHACRALYNDPKVRNAIRSNPPSFIKDIVKRYSDSLFLRRNKEIVETNEIDFKGLERFKAQCTASNAKEIISTMRQSSCHA